MKCKAGCNDVDMSEAMLAKEHPERLRYSRLQSQLDATTKPQMDLRLTATLDLRLGVRFMIY